MTLNEMHYDFIQGLNKISNKAYESYLPPDIDRLINEAMENYITNSFNSRIKNRNIDKDSMRHLEDLRPFFSSTVLTKDNIKNSYTLPEDYKFYIRSSIKSKLIYEEDNTKSVEDILQVVFKTYREDTFNSPFEKNSFNWRECYANFIENKLEIISSGDNIEFGDMELNYLRKHKIPVNVIASANYKNSLSDIFDSAGNLRPGYINKCELPEYLHSTIVNLAITNASIDSSNSQEINNKINKLKINNNEY